MKIFDTHAHYDDDSYDEDKAQLFNEMEDKGVKHIINCGSTLRGMRQSYQLAQDYPFVHAALGIHPSNGHEWNDAVEEELRRLLANDKVVAVGEIGLDYYWEDTNPSHEAQQEILARQYELARAAQKPVILHIRDAYGDMADFLRRNQDVPAVLHSYSGSLEIAREMTGYGFMLGIGGVVTFKNARKLVEVVQEIPIEFLLTETDAPYLTADPFRGKRNRSDYIKYVIKKIAMIKGLDETETAEILYDNAMRFFKVKDS